MLDKKKIIMITALVIILLGGGSFLMLNKSSDDGVNKILSDAKKNSGSTDTTNSTGALPGDGSTTVTTGEVVPNVISSAQGPTKLSEVSDNKGGNIEDKFGNFVKDLQDLSFNTYTKGTPQSIDSKNVDAAKFGSKIFSNVTFYVTPSAKKVEIAGISVVADIAGGKVCKVTIEAGKTRTDSKIITGRCVPGSAKDTINTALNNLQLANPAASTKVVTKK